MTGEDDIKIDLQEIGWEGMDRINMTQERDKLLALVDKEMNLQVPQNAQNLASWELSAITERTCSM